MSTAVAASTIFIPGRFGWTKPLSRRALRPCLASSEPAERPLKSAAPEPEPSIPATPIIQVPFRWDNLEPSSLLIGVLSFEHRQENNEVQRGLTPSELSKKIIGTDDAATLLKLLDKNMHLLNAISISASWFALGKILRGDSRMRQTIIKSAPITLDALASKTAKLLPNMTDKSLVSTMLGLTYIQDFARFRVLIALFEVRLQQLILSGNMSPLSCRNFLWCCATMGQRPQSIRTLGILQEYTAKEAQNISPEQMAIIIWAFAKLKIRPSDGTLFIWLESFSAHISRYEGRHVSIIFWAYGKFGYQILDSMMPDIENRIIETMASFQQRELSNLIYGYAKMNRQPSETVFTEWQSRASKALEDKRQSKSQHISNIAWSLAHLGRPPRDDLRSVMIAQMHGSLAYFSSQELSNFVWAFTQLGVPVPQELWLAIGEQAIARSMKFSDQGIANLLWSYSKNQIVPQDGVLDELSLRARDICRSLDGLKFVALFHSFAVIYNVRKGEWTKMRSLMDSFLDRAQELFLDEREDRAGKNQNMDGQCIANLIWSLAKTECRPSAELLTAIQNLAIDSEIQFTGQGISNILWAFANLKILPTQSLLQKFIDSILGDVTFSPQGTANTLWSISVLSGLTDGASLYREEELIAALSQQMQGCVNEMNCAEIVMAVDALKSLEIHDPAVVQAAAQRAVGLEEELSESERQSVVDSLSAINKDMTELEMFN